MGKIVNLGGVDVDLATLARVGTYFTVVGLARDDEIDSVGRYTPVSSYVAAGDLVATAAMLFGRVRCDRIGLLGYRLKIKKYRESPIELAKKLERDLSLIVAGGKSDCVIRGSVGVKTERDWLSRMARFAAINRPEDFGVQATVHLTSFKPIKYDRVISEKFLRELVAGVNVSPRRYIKSAMPTYLFSIATLIRTETLKILDGWTVGPRLPPEVARALVEELPDVFAEVIARIRDRGFASLPRQPITMSYDLQNFATLSITAASTR